jgi:Mor family transcriptional regulator
MTDKTFFSHRMHEFVDVVGMTATSVRVLIHAHGGTRITIPRKIKGDHWLTTLIGAQNAQALSSYYGGEEIELPMGPFSHAAERRDAIRRLDRSGLSYEQIARRTGCDRRTVIRHVKGTSNRPMDTSQPNLFGDHHPRPRKSN